MENYDENLSENSFFQVLQSHHVNLCLNAAKNNWIVCIPRAGSLPKYAFTDEDLQTHIFFAVEDANDEQQTFYKTLNDKDVSIHGNVITTGASFANPSTVHILFEETYYVDSDFHFRILCLESPLGGSTVSSHDSGRFFCLTSLKDCVDLLWTETGGQSVTKEIDKLIQSFNAHYLSLEGESLQKHKDAVHSLYASSMQVVLKNSRIRKRQYMIDNIKLAVETFVLHGVYDILMRGISSCLGYQDSKLNKNIRNLSDLQLRDLNVRTEFFPCIPRARRELSRLSSYTTPLGKIGCLKRTVSVLSSDPSIESKDGKRILISTDDLLPIFIFLIIRTNIPNWLAQWTFMKYFKLSTSVTYEYDEFGFYQTSLEAAIEHIKSGALFGTSSPECIMGYSGSPVRESLPSNLIYERSTIINYFEAVRTGNDLEVRKYLEADIVPKEENKTTMSLCHPLCSCDRCETLQRQDQLDSRPTVDTRDERGYTALHLASVYGHTSVLEVLLEHQADVNATDYRGYTALHLSSLRGHHNSVLLLLHFKADWNMADNEGNTALHLAAANGHKDVVNALLYYTSHKVTSMAICINAANDSGDTPLHFASRWGYENIIKILIDHGAVVELQNRRKMTPIDFAHNSHIIKILVKAIETEHERNNNGFIPIEPVDKKVTPQLSIQSFEDAEFAVEAPEIMPAESSTNLSNMWENMDKLLVAVADDDLVLVKFYLGWDDANESDNEDDGDNNIPGLSPPTLCHPLCQCDKCASLAKHYMIKSESDLNVNSSNYDGFSPLHVAVMQNRYHLAELFLKKGANVNAVNKSQRATSLHYACQKNLSEMVRLLLQHDAKINLKDMYDNTSLHYCAINGHVQPAKLLLDGGAKVNLSNYKGNTPLHEATKRNNENLVHLLLKYDASRIVSNRHCFLPYQLAQNKELRQILMPQENRKDAALPIVRSRHPMVEYYPSQVADQEKLRMLSFGQPPLAAAAYMSSSSVMTSVVAIIFYGLLTNKKPKRSGGRKKIDDNERCDEFCMVEINPNKSSDGIVCRVNN